MKIRRFILSPKFELLIGCVIVIDMALLGAEFQLLGRDRGAALGLETGGSLHDEHHGWLHPFLYIFVAVYAIEFCLRMWATKKAFFRGFYNLFDALILGTGLAEIVLIFFGESISFLRALRLCRLCRVLRLAKVVRLMAVCQDLYIIFKTLSSSVYSLAWSMMFVFLCIFGSGLVLCEIVGEVLEERSHDPAALAWAYEHFGTTTRTVYSLFEATFTAKWTALARPMISDLHWLFSIYWVLFVIIVNFAIIRYRPPL